MVSKYQRKFKFEMCTPDEQVISTEAVCVIFPAADGQVGILYGHAPLVAMIGAGKVTIDQEDGSQLNYFIARGFAQVRDNFVTILAEECQTVDSLDADEAREQLNAAASMPYENGQQAVRRQEAINCANAKLRVASAQS